MACSGRRGGRECATSAAAGRHIGLSHGAPAAFADSGRADRRRRPSNRSRRYKRLTRLLSCFANQRTFTRGEQHVKRGGRASAPSHFARPGRRGRRGRSGSRDLGDRVGGDEAELRRVALRGSSSSERAKGGERRMVGQSLLRGRTARLLGRANTPPAPFAQRERRGRLGRCGAAGSGAER